jgi:probable phosphoglycerate mutase
VSESPSAGQTAQREAHLREHAHASITLLRHGEPDWVPAGGEAVADPWLTPYGREQAVAAAGRLQKTHFDAIYVSPNRRARETAAPLLEAVDMEPLIIDDLAEVETAAHGLDQNAADAYFSEGARRPLVEHWEGWPGAETFHDFHARVTGALANILDRHGVTARKEHDFTVWSVPDPAPHIAIVAHCGTNAVALTHLLDVRPVPWEWLRFESELAAFSVVHARPLGPSGYVWSLQNFNEVDHLVGAGLR